MGMQDYLSALEIVRSHPQWAHFVGGKEEALITAAEETLGHSFPPTYRRFLQDLGAGSFAGAEFYGIINTEYIPMPPDAIGLTLAERKQVGLPEHYLIVYDADDGFYYLLDLARQTLQDENPIVLWNEGEELLANNILPIEWSDFGAFFFQFVQEAADARINDISQ